MPENQRFNPITVKVSSYRAAICGYRISIPHRCDYTKNDNILLDGLIEVEIRDIYTRYFCKCGQQFDIWVYIEARTHE